MFVLQDGETPLIKATKMRNIEIVELLLDKGAKVAAVDRVWLTKKKKPYAIFSVLSSFRLAN